MTVTTDPKFSKLMRLVTRNPYWVDDPAAWREDMRGIGVVAGLEFPGLFNLGWLFVSRENPEPHCGGSRHPTYSWIFTHSRSWVFQGQTLEWHAATKSLPEFHAFTKKLNQYTLYNNIAQMYHFTEAAEAAMARK